MGAPESFILGDFTVAQCSRCLKTPLGNGESYFRWSVKASLGRIFRAANWPCISIQKDRELGDLLLFVYMLPKNQNEKPHTTHKTSTGGPLDMRILGLVKTRISGKSHSENHKVVIPYVHDFSLVCEIKITFAAKYLFTH